MADLFNPIKINSLKLKNRIVFPPMARELSKLDGEVTEDLIKHYKQMSKDTGLVIVEHAYISQQGKRSQNQLGIHKDQLIPGLKEIVQAVKKNGAAAASQINHAGGRTKKEITGKTPVAPSTPYFKEKGKNVKKLDLEEIKEIQNQFKEAARRAEEAGFDAVEVHGAHGFLLSEFLSPLTNQRNDKYGGSLENRVKMPLETVEKVSKETNNTSLLYRLGASDRHHKGLKIDEAQKFAEKLVKKGVDLIDVSGGLCGSRPKDLQNKQGYFLDLAQKIKKTVTAPVIGVGGIKNPSFADQAIKQGKTDLIAIGRERLKNPDWPQKARQKLAKQTKNKK